MPEEPRPNRKHINQIKVRLDDEFEEDRKSVV